MIKTQMRSKIQVSISFKDSIVSLSRIVEGSLHIQDSNANALNKVFVTDLKRDNS